MKTIKIKNQTIKGYEFDDLTEEVKERVLEEQRESLMNVEYFWGDDAIKSLEKFIEHFNCTLDNYSIDFYEKYRCEIKINTYDNHYNVSKLRELIKSMGKYDHKTLKGLGNCKFTGYCADEDCADGARKAFFDGERDLFEILYAGYESWWNAVNKNYEYQFTDEAIIEDNEANSYLFDKEGNKVIKTTYNNLEIEIL